MEISIANFRNVEHLNMSIKEGKVNYLFGVCGSGKSSILAAIARPIEPIDSPIGKTQSPTVKIDGDDPSYEGVSLYGFKRQQALFERSPSEDCYRIFVGDEEEIKHLEAAFKQSIQNLRDVRARLHEFRGDVDDLLKALGKPGANGFTKSSKVNKAHGALVTTSTEMHQLVKSSSLDYLEWRTHGFAVSDAFEAGICPFCDQRLPDAAKQRLEAFRDLAVKELKPIFQASSYLTNLGIKEPNYADADQVEELKDKIIEAVKARDEIDKVIKYCNVADGLSLLQGVPRDVQIDPVAYEFVPELEPLIKDVNDRKQDILQVLGSMAAALNVMVGNNAKQLNMKIRSVGIPYQLSVVGPSSENRTASYVLRHAGVSEGDDVRDCLSYGEKNLITLLLFLHNDESQLLLIDDPASSYDDFRRSQIYSCIMEHPGKTMLVVSHDQAFIRRAVSDPAKHRLGNILFLENASNGCRVKPILKSSYVLIDEEIRRRIAGSKTFFQQSINLRLYCDIHKDEVGEVAWGYSSAILHGSPSAEINKLLSDAGQTEATVLEKLEDMIGLKLMPLPGVYERLIDDNFTDYEILVLAREKFSVSKREGTLSRDDSILLDMLHDLVHMNDCALHCLNPYEFAIWPPSFADVIKKYRSKQNCM